MDTTALRSARHQLGNDTALLTRVTDGLYGTTAREALSGLMLDDGREEQPAGTIVDDLVTHLDAELGVPDDARHGGRYSTHYYVHGKPHASAFHSPHNAAEWLRAAEAQGALAPVSVVDNYTGELLADEAMLTAHIPY